MDILTLAQLNKLKKNGGVGYTSGERYEIIVDPANSYDVVDFGGGSFFAKVSDLAPTMDEFVGAVISGPDGEGGTAEMVVERPMLVVLDGGWGYHVMSRVVVVTESFDVFTPGIYFMAEALEDEMVYTLTWGNETIHKIDPKFIPGAVLPVLEITTLQTQETVQLNEVESATMEAMLENGVQFILVTMIVQGFVAGNTILRRADIEGVPTFSGSYNIPGIATSVVAGQKETIPAMIISKDPELNMWVIAGLHLG